MHGFDVETFPGIHVYKGKRNVKRSRGEKKSGEVEHQQRVNGWTATVVSICTGWNERCFLLSVDWS